jgi:ABC-2 type transport system ATP-binding protein
MAVCGRPKLLFLDEPTVGLDVQARQAMWAVVRQLVHDGCSIVLTTHYLEEAEALADRIVVLVKGRVVASGSVRDIRARVARKHVTCTTRLAAEEVAAWPGVESARSDQHGLHVVTDSAEELVRRLISADNSLRDLEVRRAGLADAFAELTQERAS